MGAALGPEPAEREPAGLLVHPRPLQLLQLSPPPPAYHRVRPPLPAAPVAAHAHRPPPTRAERHDPPREASLRQPAERKPRDPPAPLHPHAAPVDIGGYADYAAARGRLVDAE